MIMALGQRPKLPQSLYSEVNLTHIVNREGHSGLGQWFGQFFGSIKEAAVQQLGSTERWSPDNMLSSYITGDHQSSF